jgi:hypothetical protein
MVAPVTQQAQAVYESRQYLEALVTERAPGVCGAPAHMECHGCERQRHRVGQHMARIG